KFLIQFNVRNDLSRLINRNQYTIYSYVLINFIPILIARHGNNHRNLERVFKTRITRETIIKPNIIDVNIKTGSGGKCFYDTLYIFLTRNKGIDRSGVGSNKDLLISTRYRELQPANRDFCDLNAFLPESNSFHTFSIGFFHNSDSDPIFPSFPRWSIEIHSITTDTFLLVRGKPITIIHLIYVLSRHNYPP